MVTKQKNKIKGYEIIVQGQYYSLGDGSNKGPLKQYPKQTFYLPEVVTYREGNTFKTIKVEGKTVETDKVIPNVKRTNARKPSLHLIRRFHLEPKLKEDLDDFIKVRTCRIFSIKETMIDQDDFLKKKIDDMSEAELNQFVAIHNLNVYLTMYGDLVSQKEAVKEVFQAKLEEIESKKEVITEETNIYQAQLDAIGEESEEDPLAYLMD